ncbi:lipoprotein N-acyltransferase Lnb domain-containing protein [Winogradskyella undariae]|uniref:lipoprotein N-acyltransferase Lnb domain-containing protein n=1 Tax=Winogradskyella undariae TaxID=1285465 RepID=UPI003463F8A7
MSLDNSTVMKLKLSVLVLLFTCISGFSQQYQLSDNAKISVITIGPGESLNDAFGHNAFRIKDKALGIDVVYGYGEYDFDAPNFYLKFAQGKLNYLISRHPFQNFFYAYKRANRTIEEQVLNLSTQDKQKLFNYLENNYKPENRRYLYDFFYDNCATRIRDVTQNTTSETIDFILPQNFEPKTFRDLIHEHVGLNTWGSFGIDIALGAVIDKQATAEEFMFLPKYIHTFFETAKLNTSKNLVKSATTLYQKKETNTKSNFIVSPLVIIGLLAACILFITYKDYKNKVRSKWLDISLFALTGLIGIVLLLLWFATDHSATALNYNVLWAFPLNLFVIGQLAKPKVKIWFKKYLRFLIIMLCLIASHWIIGVQVFAIGLIPLLIALVVRYVYLVKWFNLSEEE